MLRSLPITKDYAGLAEVERLAREAFPPGEYLAPARMIGMAEGGNFDFWALSDGGQFVGFMTVMTCRRMAYLFFLAIDGPHRSRGYGAESIRLLRTLYPGRQQVVDLEMQDERADNRLQRERRRRFYLRNGYRPTGHFLSYLGVDYEVLCAEESFDFGTFQELMKQIDIEGFAPRWFGGVPPNRISAVSGPGNRTAADV